MPVPDAFITALSAEVAEFKQVEDGSDLPKDDDPIVKLACRVAYAQIETFCRCPLYNGTYIDCYSQVEDSVLLRVQPVVSITEVKFTGSDEIIDPASYKLLAGKLVLSEDVWFLFGNEEPTPIDLTVEYVGGYANYDSDDRLRGALVMQAVAMYNRKDLLGFSNVNTGKGNILTSSDKGGLLDAVRGLLEPFVYYGGGAPC